MTTTTIQINDKVREMNLQINSQLKRAGILDHKGRNVKSLQDEPESEWKTWMLDLIDYRDELEQQLEDYANRTN